MHCVILVFSTLSQVLKHKYLGYMEVQSLSCLSAASKTEMQRISHHKIYLGS